MPGFGAVIRTSNPTYLKISLIQLLSVHQSPGRGRASLHLVSQHAWELHLRIQFHSPQNPSTWKEVFSPSFSQFIYLQNQDILANTRAEKWYSLPSRGGCKTTDAVRTGAWKKDDWKERKERKWMRWWGRWKILRRLSRRRLKVRFYFIFLIIYIYFAPRPNENLIILTYFLGGADKIELCPLLSLWVPTLLLRLFSSNSSPPTLPQQITSPAAQDCRNSSTGKTNTKVHPPPYLFIKALWFDAVQKGYYHTTSELEHSGRSRIAANTWAQEKVFLFFWGTGTSILRSTIYSNNSTRPMRSYESRNRYLHQRARTLL